MSSAFDIETFHREAVDTPSHEDVTAMREVLLSALSDAGHSPRVDDAGNVIASRGSGEPQLVLNTHIDTVPPHIAYERDGDIVRGRGACDAKGPLAALLSAFLSVDPDAGTLTLAITPNEETVQTGGKALAESLRADGYIVGEPTGLDVCTAARGQFEGIVTLEGKSAHASDPDSGINAISAASHVFAAMDSYDDDRGPGVHEHLGAPTLSPTLIEGGDAANQIPGSCRVTFDRRSVPPETSSAFMTDFASYLRERVPAEIGVNVDFSDPEAPSPEAFSTDTDTPLVETLSAASGGEVRPFGAATEASYFAADAPTVVFGPGVLADEQGPVAHSEREYVPLPAVHDAAEAVTTTLRRLLQ